MVEKPRLGPAILEESAMFRIRTVAPVVLALAFPLTVLAQIPGSIRTFDTSAVPVDGAPVPTDHFDAREDAFLAAGSAATPCRSVEDLADGGYYFQVTSATGSKLLSSDPAAERKVTVKNGVFCSYDGTTHDTLGKTACNSLAVRLAPYDDAGALKAAYLVWLTPVASFEGKATDVGPVCGAGCFFGFRPK